MLPPKCLHCVHSVTYKLLRVSTINQATDFYYNVQLIPVRNVFEEKRDIFWKRDV